MDDALLVRGFEGFGNLLRDRQRLVDRNRSLRDPVRERRPLDQLHDERLHAVRLLEAVDVRDVRMIERGEDLRLAFEPRQAIRIGGEEVRKHLQRDVAIEPRVPRPIHFPHAASPKQRENLVRAEAAAGVQGQTVTGLYGREGSADGILLINGDLGTLRPDSRVPSACGSNPS